MGKGQEMTNIIKFPRQIEAVAEIKQPAVATLPKTTAGSSVGAAVIKGIWVLTVLVWPILKWVVSIDCVFQFARMLYHWNTPGIHAGFTFLMHFAVLTALTYFVSIYKPKGL